MIKCREPPRGVAIFVGFDRGGDRGWQVVKATAAMTN